MCKEPHHEQQNQSYVYRGSPNQLSMDTGR
jgi:hypothetical protein